ncbi:MAG TPA: hypothetical protein VGK79_02995 [Gaiellaceae bacterium]|jgi:hypothetical protein
MVDLDPVLVAELERIAPAEPVPQLRWEQLRPRRTSLRLIAAAAVVAAVVALAVPWHRGPAALSPAQAAQVLQRTATALASHGRVLHVRTHVTVASPYHPKAIAWSGDEEHWIDERGEQSYRLRTTFPNLPAPVETGGDFRGTSPTYVYDTANGTLYYVPLYGTGPGSAFVDPVALVRRDLRSHRASVRRVGDTYRIEEGRNVLVVDALTYRPLREISTVGAGAPFALFSQKPNAPLSEEWQTIQEYRVYEYVADAKLASIRAQHPRAKVGIAPDMPPSFKRQYAPWTG